MDKMPIDVDELIKELRNKHKAYVLTGNANAGEIFKTAADALEQYRNKDKFNLFIWETLGQNHMNALIAEYREQEGKE